MARRSAPPGSGPAYISPSFGSGPGPSRLHDSSHKQSHLSHSQEKEKEEGVVGKFLKEEVFAPEYFMGNVSVLGSVLVFVGGVFVFRRWGDVLTVGLD